jgi:microcin C transport system permease protein
VDARTPIADAAALGVPPRPRGRFSLSPINKRRWQNFKANRRGYVSFWLFLVLFVVSLFAEFIANDKPILVRLEGKTFFPVFATYPETAFGGEFETAAEYRDPYLRKLIADKGGTIVWPPIHYSYGTHNLNLPTPAPCRAISAVWSICCSSGSSKSGPRSRRSISC